LELSFGTSATSGSVCKDLKVGRVKRMARGPIIIPPVQVCFSVDFRVHIYLEKLRKLCQSVKLLAQHEIKTEIVLFQTLAHVK